VEQVVPGSAADKAGLKVGDVIVKADGKDIKTSDDLRRALQAKKPGDTMALQVVRNGASQTIQVTVGSRPVTAS
jgi:serine protease Do